MSESKFAVFPNCTPSNAAFTLLIVGMATSLIIVSNMDVVVIKIILSFWDNRLFDMVSEHLHDPLDRLLNGFPIRPSTIYIRAPSPIALGTRECVKKSHIGCEIA
ncbi:hypothetical protein A2U01_0008960 [Trifolium medium]|uniref:Uncharacterized protein n=1 Tax=Trifolium medium TaxID=97028 RepID=A0A392MM86_9FABA|nr:hypothetical protein [Trifolium medium]